MVDPIADMLTRIRNAQAVGKETVDAPFSKLCYGLAKILERQGFLRSVEFKGRSPRKIIVIRLKYSGGKPAISQVKRVSRPGQRLYAGAREIGKTKGGYGLAILSTSRGLMSEREAIKQKAGGEIICRIW